MSATSQPIEVSQTKKMLTSIAALATVAFAAPGKCAATGQVKTVCDPNLNLLGNPQFLTQPCGGSWCLSTDSSRIAPWSITSNYKTYEIDPSGTFGAVQGVNSMDLNSDNKVTLGQSLKTIAGQTYTLTFSLNQNPCGPSMTKTGFVSAVGTASQPFTISNTATQQISYAFKASSDSTLVQIGSTTESSSCGPVVFNFKVVQGC